MKKIRSCSFCHTAGVTIRNYMLLTFLMLGASGIQAQIIYTDIIDTVLTFPEETPLVLDDSTNYFYFDLDADGNNDFYFYAHYWEEWLSPTAPEHPHYVMQLESMVSTGIPWSNGCAVDFAYADTIRNDEWESWGLLYIDIVGFSDNCSLPFQDRYIGLLLEEDTNKYYGWIRLDASTDTLVFKDFAVNTIANEPIFAGQTNYAGFNEDRISSNESTAYFDGISLHFDQEHFSRYSIFNLQGKLIEDRAVSNNGIKNIKHLPSGFYIVNLIGTNNLFSIKIIKP